MKKLKLPKIIGHRGVFAYAPENTLEGIHTAADMDVEWVEFDVKLTKDHVPILFHDDVLDRTTNGSGLVAEATYEEIRQLEAGSAFSESFAGIKIPTLDEALEVLIDRGMGLNLEMKPCAGREEETAEVILDHLSHVWDDHEKLYISSYSSKALEIARDMAPGWALGKVFGYHSEELVLKALQEGGLPDNFAEMIEALELRAISIDSELATDGIIIGIQDQGIIPVPYNVNDSARMYQLQALGIACVISDMPDVIEDDTLMTVH